MTEKKLSLRQLVNMKHLPSLPGRRSQSMELAPAPDIVSVRTFTQGAVHIHWRDGLTVEHICMEAAQKCGIPRFMSNLCGLYNTTSGAWLPPSFKIERTALPAPQKLVYRVRFHTSMATPPGESSGLLLLEESVVNYMFCQYRECFVNDEIRGLSTEESLGLIVLDFLQAIKDNQAPPVPVNQTNGRLHFSHFLPRSLNDGLSWWDKRKLRRKVRATLTDFRDDPREAFAFKVMFLVSLSEEMKQTWGTEQFLLANGDVYEVSGTKGVERIKAAYGDEINAHDSFPFEDIINIAIYSTNPETGQALLQVNKRSSPPLFLNMKSRSDALSFACLLDGYYRLLIDYYHYLNEEVAPPSLVRLVKNRCHGPIPLSKAKQKIEEMGHQDGVYLIRQNPEDYSSYCLTVRIDRELKNFKINQYQDGQVGLDNQPKFPSLRAFVEHYRSRENSWCLEGQLRRAVPIEPKERALRLIDNSALNEQLPSQPEPGPQIQWIREESLSPREQWRHLGDGDFTRVCVAEFRKPIGNKVRRLNVAMKCPKPDAPQTVQQKFSQSVDLMSSWTHKHIIRFEGIGAGYMLIMEYASQGPLDTYIRSLVEHERRGLGANSQIWAGIQVIDALEYLESRRIVHGNVSAHNVLVLRGTPKLHIKLGDPMLSVYYHSLEMTNPQKLKRVRWTAPELLATNSEPTLAGDKFSFAITLWQIMAQGAIPADHLRDEQVRDTYRQGMRPEKPAACPDDVLRVIEQCWAQNPRDRPPCRGVLRDLNTFLQTSCSDEAPYMTVFQDDEEVERIPEEDEEMGEQNDANERRDANSTQTSPYESAEGRVNSLEAAGGAAVTPSILGQIEKALNFNHEQDFDPEEETRFYGVDRIQDAMLKKEEPLGDGHFGMVFRGKLKNLQPGFPEEDVAVKVIKSHRRDSKPEMFQQEIRAMSRCDHKNIVKVLGYCEDNTNRLQLVMEYFPLGSLQKYLRDKKDCIPHKTLYLFGQQICQGMNYLHEEHRMVHRDLAARNVLVANENEVKITDFGLARIFGEDKDYYRAKETNQKVPIRWYAPEWLLHNKYQKESDVWSLGIVLWEMFSYGQEPFYRDNYGHKIEPGKLLDHLESGTRLPPPATCPSAIYTIMMDCWQMDPMRRPKFKDLIVRLGQLIQREEC